MTTPRLFVICGLPRAGKTTRAKEISSSTGAIRLCADDWLEALGISLLDYETRFRLEPHLLRHAEGELHFLDAPIEELARRVRERGGAHASGLVEDVLSKYSGKFERPTTEEVASYDRYVGPA